MKLTIQQKELAHAVELVRQVAARSSGTFVLQCLFLETVGPDLVVTATNLEVAMRAKAVAYIQKTGAAAIPAGRFGKVVQELPEGEVTIETDGAFDVTLIAGAVVVRLTGTDPGNFLDWPKLGEVEAFFEFVPSALKEALSRVAPFATEDHGRHVLRNVLFEAHGNRVRLVASDGRRVSVDALRIPWHKDFSFCLPPDAVAHVVRACQGEVLQCNVAENLMTLVGERVELVAKLSEDTFPSWQKATQCERSGVAEVDRCGLVAALKRVRLCANPKVQLRFEPKVLSLFSQFANVGEAQEVLEVDFEGEPFSAFYNVEFLLEAVEVMSGENVVFSLPTDSMDPLKLADSVGEHFHVLMPIKSA